MKGTKNILIAGSIYLAGCAEIQTVVPQAELVARTQQTCTGLAEGGATNIIFQGITTAEPLDRKVQITPKVANWYRQGVLLRKKAEPWMTAQYLQ